MEVAAGNLLVEGGDPGVGGACPHGAGEDVRAPCSHPSQHQHLPRHLHLQAPASSYFNRLGKNQERSGGTEQAEDGLCDPGDGSVELGVGWREGTERIPDLAADVAEVAGGCRSRRRRGASHGRESPSVFFQNARVVWNKVFWLFPSLYDLRRVDDYCALILK